MNINTLKTPRNVAKPAQSAYCQLLSNSAYCRILLSNSAYCRILRSLLTVKYHTAGPIPIINILFRV